MNKVLVKYTPYYYINLIDNAMNYVDLIFEHWKNECAYF